MTRKILITITFLCSACFLHAMDKLTIDFDIIPAITGNESPEDSPAAKALIVLANKTIDEARKRLKTIRKTIKYLFPPKRAPYTVTIGPRTRAKIAAEANILKRHIQTDTESLILYINLLLQDELSSTMEHTITKHKKTLQSVSKKLLEVQWPTFNFETNKGTHIALTKILLSYQKIVVTLKALNEALSTVS